jgi:hypothetical protein
MTNNYKWDLSKLYTGYDDPIFLKDYDQLVNYKIENVNTNTSFKQLEEIKDLEYRLRLYVTDPLHASTTCLPQQTLLLPLVESKKHVLHDL